MRKDIVASLWVNNYLINGTLWFSQMLLKLFMNQICLSSSKVPFAWLYTDTHTVRILNICVSYIPDICFSQMLSSHCELLQMYNASYICCDSIQTVTALIHMQSSLNMIKNTCYAGTFLLRATLEGHRRFPLCRWNYMNEWLWPLNSWK